MKKKIKKQFGNYDLDELLNINRLSNDNNELAIGGIDSLLEQWYYIEDAIKNKSFIVVV